ncbi:hypothetical protein MC885_014054 [Smutsia gigantea]|nr:hypothetical protein MC885_014054 [Smutsia gigantea]
MWRLRTIDQPALRLELTRASGTTHGPGLPPRSALPVGEVVTTIPTAGFNLETVTYKNLKFQAWDLGGQTSAVIYAVDHCDRDRIGISKSELVAMLEEEELRKAILVVLANKQDMEQAMTP